MPRPRALDRSIHASGRGGRIRPRILVVACVTILISLGLAILITHWYCQPERMLTVVTVPAVVVDAPLMELDPARVRHRVALPLIPRPKSVRTGPGRPVPIAAVLRILVPSESDPLLKQGAGELQAALSKSEACVPRVAALEPGYGKDHGHGHAGSSGQVDVLVTDARWLARSPLAGSLHADVPEQPEGYWLAVEADRVVIVGRDTQGAYWGVQTLKQLVTRDDKGTACIRPVIVKDWPSLAMRGIHLLGGRESGPVHLRMIERVLAPLKINTLVFQTDYARWRSQPDIWDEHRSTPLEDVRKTVACARAHGIEPIPLISALSHTAWMFRNGKNQDLMLPSLKGYMYDPHQPRTYDVLHGILEEVLEIFRPRLVHIGHDEVVIQARDDKEFHPGVKVFATDTVHLADWLRQRGARTMIWGDMLLFGREASSQSGARSQQDATWLRQALPRDILVADWQYGSGEVGFPSVTVLQDAGFTVVGASWADPHNIRTFSYELTRRKSLGMLQTTWAGYELSPRHVLGSDFYQFTSWVVAAEQAWNGGSIDTAALGYNPEEAFLALYSGSNEVSPQLQPCVGVDLRSVANIDALVWGAEAATPAHPLPTVPGTESQPVVPLPRGRVTLGGIAYQMTSAVRLSEGASAKESIQALEIPLQGQRVRNLDFAWGTAGSCPAGTMVARLELVREDGSEQDLPIRLGQQIASLADLSVSVSLPRIWEGWMPGWGRAALHRWEWPNPHPDTPLRAMRLVSTSAEASVVILAITAQLPGADVTGLQPGTRSPGPTCGRGRPTASARGPQGCALAGH